MTNLYNDILLIELDAINSITSKIREFVYNQPNKEFVFKKQTKFLGEEDAELIPIKLFERIEGRNKNLYVSYTFDNEECEDLVSDFSVDSLDTLGYSISCELIKDN